SRYYPDSPNRAGALPVEIEPGGTSPHLQLRLAESGGTVRARIVSEDSGEGIPGLLVEARSGGLQSFARTGPDGSVAIPGVPAGSVTLRTRPDDVRSVTGAHAIRYAPGVPDSTDALRLDLDDGASVDFGTVPIPEGGRIKATVLDPDGEPWPAIPVVLRSDAPPLRRVHPTDADGRVTFGGLAPGDYRLWADARGTVGVSEAWDGSRDTLSSEPLAVERGSLIGRITITPDRGGRILGAVRHENSGAGLPGLEVRVFPSDDPTAFRSDTTDAIGFYQVLGLPTGSYKVHVPAIRRYYPQADSLQEARSVSVTEPEAVSSIDVRGLPDPECTLGPGAAAVIEGTVEADFARFPSARVVVWSEEDTASITVTGEGLYRHDCLESGTYRAAILPDGVYRAQYHPGVSDPDSAATISVAAGDSVSAIDFEPELGVVLEGSIASADLRMPIEGVPVIADLEGTEVSIHTVTGDGGGFRIDRLPDGTGLPAGRWIVRTDSLTVVRVAVTPVRRIALSAARVPGGVALSFALPDGATDWTLERIAGGRLPEPVTGADRHPDGLRAATWRDPDPPPGALYRLTARLLRSGGTDTLRSEWIAAPPAAPVPRALYPQPWSGRGPLILPVPPTAGEPVDLFGIDGARVRRLRLQGTDRISPERFAGLPSGVYFLRWRDVAGAERIHRLVLDR
ncbi:MAG: hypothetical protein GF346_12520, partial [Candidatus Eisenbacteria bacterium]|nr:hypothetical protein [Candidatus Latescibacterota bacterium]MBD3303261.1 hypothetical protein [Candidatus Eisenbacteria bacterium]